MRRLRILLLYIYLFIIHTGLAAQNPKYEVRAAWVTTAYGLDWPHNKATSPSSIRKQQEDLINILDKLKAANFNTVLFQARTRGDVFYRSQIEPFNAILTGTVAGDPGYDPLAFVVDECHKRGMECHAWIVTMPLGNKKHVASLGKYALTRRNPDICTPYKKEYFLNPGNPKTKEYLMSIVREIIDKYDVDGVHFDYLRYPEYAPNFPDSYDYRKYSNGRDLAQWRRDNLTEIIRYIYKEVKAEKPWVKVSTCPVGKYKDTSRYSSRGWNAFYTVYQDVQGWLGEGIQDQIYPMMYFRGNSFYPFALDWQEQSNGRQVIPGLGIYFLHPSEGNWTIDEVERQINFVRAHKLAGEGHYRVKYLVDNTQGLYDALIDTYYTSPALVPAMPWIDNIAPTAPAHLNISRQEDGYVHLKWEAAKDNDVKNKPAYVIYGSNTYPVDISDPENILAPNIKDTEFTYVSISPWMEKKYFAVTATDRCGNESKVLQQELKKVR